MNVGERETYIGLQLDVLRRYYVYVLAHEEFAGRCPGMPWYDSL